MRQSVVAATRPSLLPPMPMHLCRPVSTMASSQKHHSIPALRMFNALHIAGRRYRMLIFSTRPHTMVCAVYLRWQTARIGPKSRPKSRLRKPRKLLLPFSVRIKTKLAPTAAPKLPRGRPSTLDVLFVCDAAVSTATWVCTSPRLSPSRLMIGCLAGLKPSMKMATLA